MDFSKFIINPNDIQRILIGAGGKLSPDEFAQGLVFIVAANIVLQILGLVLGFLGVLWMLISLVIGIFLIFGWVCIFSKRFHDAGKSGWMTLAALLAVIVIGVVLSVILTPIFMGGAMQAAAQGGSMFAPQVTAGSVIMGIIVNVIANGAVGFYMYNLKPGEAAPAA